MFCQFLLFALINSDFHTLTAADDQCGSCPKHSFPSSGGRRTHTVLLITHLMWVHITQLEKAQMNILSSFTQTYMFSVSLSVEGRLSFRYFTNTWLCPSIQEIKLTGLDRHSDPRTKDQFLVASSFHTAANVGAKTATHHFSLCETDIIILICCHAFWVWSLNWR